MQYGNAEVMQTVGHWTGSQRGKGGMAREPAWVYANLP